MKNIRPVILAFIFFVLCTVGAVFQLWYISTRKVPETQTQSSTKEILKSPNQKRMVVVEGGYFSTGNICYSYLVVHDRETDTDYLWIDRTMVKLDKKEAK